MGDADDLTARVGTELGVSEWLEVTQPLVDAYAEVTGDREWLHNDPERARRESPFGTTIVQGSFLLANLVRFQEQVHSLATDPSLAYALNYGYDRVRFVRPVPVGSRVRARFWIRDARARDDGVVVVLDVEVEVEGQDRPALVAEWLGFVRSS